MSTVSTYCGLNCDQCDYKDKCNCGGCIETQGMPFHGECRLAKCAIEHGVQHCGNCTEFPCELLKEFSFDKEHGDNGARIEHLKKLNREESSK